jgi:hypothetical protein
VRSERHYSNYGCFATAWIRGRDEVLARPLVIDAILLKKYRWARSSFLFVPGANSSSGLSKPLSTGLSSALAKRGVANRDLLT